MTRYHRYRHRVRPCPHCGDSILRSEYRNHVGQYCKVVRKERRAHKEKILRALGKIKPEEDTTHEDFDRAKRVIE